MALVTTLHKLHAVQNTIMRVKTLGVWGYTSLPPAPTPLNLKTPCIVA